MSSLYIVMPAYNEAENLPEVVTQWHAVLDGIDGKLVIADSGSTDTTHEVLQNLQKTFPKLEILENTGKQHGPKLIALYNYAIQQGADYVFQTDSDGQTNPEEFAAFWGMRNDYDAIIGNRTIRGDGKSRAFVERVVCAIVRLIFGVKVPDANAPFRLMKTSLLKKYMGMFAADYNLPNIMLTTFFVYYHEKVTFKVISFKPRKAGKNSINLRKIVKIGWKALFDFNSFKKMMRK